ncbi:MAG TPA: SGNH/GDSL hydrolase family protein [Ktedonobacterales bacterium]|nr:SGNH/GDSL hydrolase family protein [Ktedonobacterales bacterium]
MTHRMYLTAIPALIALLFANAEAHMNHAEDTSTQAGISVAATLPPAPQITPSPSSGATPTRVPAPQVTHTIVFLGNSLTEGMFATTQARDYAYTTAAQTGKTFVVEGQYGVTAVYTAQKMQASNPKLKVIPGDALYVVIELGTNDVAASGETLTQFKTAYDYILARVQRDAPNARLICLGTWRDPSAGVSESGHAYNQIIQSDCPNTYIPLGDLYLNNSYHGPAGRSTWLGTGDWFHPNDAGHAAIAARVAVVIS